MPRAHPTAIRHQILGLRSQGLSLVQIASQLLLPYSSVRRLWRWHCDDPARPLNPDYSRCGRRHTAATEVLFQAACALKRNHPTWGAGIIQTATSAALADNGFGEGLALDDDGREFLVGRGIGTRGYLAKQARFEQLLVQLVQREQLTLRLCFMLFLPE